MVDLKDKTYAELIEIQRNSVPGGDVHQQATQEIHRIQQDTNNIQIAKLIDETKTLKDLTKENTITSDKNARTANWIAVLAIVIALVAFFK